MQVNVLNLILSLTLTVSLIVVFTFVGVEVGSIGAMFIGITSGLMFPWIE
jgi:hypothetical protein